MVKVDVALLRYLAANKDEGEMFLALDDEDA